MTIDVDSTRKIGLFEATGIGLTDTLAMWPAASVSGWDFSHPESRYFAVGKIDRDQVADYARREGIDMATAEARLAPNLGYRADGDAGRQVA